MATTTASITISSGDLTGDSLSLTSSTTLRKAAAATGLDQTTGVARKFLAGSAGSDTDYTLLTAANFTDDKAHKVYIKYNSTSNSEYLVVKLGATEIGRLYGGDWMFIPWSADTTPATDNDLIVTAPTGVVNTTVEYLLIYEA